MSGKYKEKKVIDFNAVGCTSSGKVRELNEDRFLVDPDRRLLIVADGMGGLQAGEVAAQFVITQTPKLLERHLLEQSPKGKAAYYALRDMVVELNQQLFKEATKDPDHLGMGSTLAMVWFTETAIIMVTMGDSRIYLLRDGVLSQYSEDHTLLALIMRQTQLTAEEIKEHPFRSKLTRYIGMEEVVYPDVRLLRPEKKDRLLICSDGLSGMVDDETITKILSENKSPQKAGEALVAAANEAGGKDNITVIVSDISLS